MKKLLCLCIAFCLLLTVGCGAASSDRGAVDKPSETIRKGPVAQAADSAVPDTGFSFLFLSDTAKSVSGDYSELQGLMSFAAANLVQPKFILHGGDVVNSTDGGTEWEEYLAAMGSLADLPTYATWGEKDDQYLPAHYPLPDNGPVDLRHHFYSFSYENAHFVVLDSAYMGLQRSEYVKWLQEDLTANGKEWNILLCHYPLYPAVDQDQDLARAKAQRKIWDGVLNAAGIDLVLCGHQHLYMRSCPVADGSVAEDGVIHVMTSSGSIYSSGAGDFDYIKTSYAQGASFCYFNITGSQLTMTAYGRENQVIDTLTLDRSDEAK